jgi:dTDP-4-dehydrorhamnose 3,5-epimerase-like enzyme
MNSLPSKGKPGVAIERIRRATDQRGYVYEPLDDALLKAQRNVHVVITNPGEIRGNHFHPTGTEVTAVSGPVRVRIKDRGSTVTHDVPAGETWRFTFPAGVTHAFANTGSTPIVIVSFNTLPHDPAKPNTVRDVIL